MWLDTCWWPRRWPPFPPSRSAGRARPASRSSTTAGTQTHPASVTGAAASAVRRLVAESSSVRTVHRPPCTVHRPPYRAPSTVDRPPSTVHRPLSTVHRPLSPWSTVNTIQRFSNNFHPCIVISQQPHHESSFHRAVWTLADWETTSWKSQSPRQSCLTPIQPRPDDGLAILQVRRAPPVTSSRRATPRRTRARPAPSLCSSSRGWAAPHRPPTTRRPSRHCSRREAAAAAAAAANRAPITRSAGTPAQAAPRWGVGVGVDKTLNAATQMDMRCVWLLDSLFSIFFYV